MDCFALLWMVVNWYFASMDEGSLSNSGDRASDTSRPQHTGWNGVNSLMGRYVVCILMA